MQQQRKKRAENWNADEKDILLQLMGVSANILEDRSTKSNINNLKTKTWKDITNKLNELTGKHRSDVDVKLAWKRMKLTAKANISRHKGEQLKTGGGQKPPSPSAEDIQIMAIAPLDFVEDTNDYDSDAVALISSNSATAATTAATTATASTSSEPDPIIVIMTEEDPVQVTSNNNEMTEQNSQHKTPGKKGKTISQNKSEQGRQAIVNSNVDFKKRQLEMLELEHTYNIKISELKIKKLQLEISLMETQKTHTEGPK